jgi:NADH-quinone oxidoreductase subunit L
MIFVTFYGSYRGEIDPSELGIRHPEFAGTDAGIDDHAGHETPGERHAPAWLMSLPVALLMVPTALAGYLTIFGPAGGAWHAFLAPVFSFESAPPAEMTPVISELMSTGIVLTLVAIGIVVAFMRYGTAQAREASPERLRRESVATPPILANAFYFDAALDGLFVRPAIALGRFCMRVVDPVAIDGFVRELAWTAGWVGHWVRALQTGLVRGYALTLLFGAALFVAYYAFAVVQ